VKKGVIVESGHERVGLPTRRARKAGDGRSSSPAETYVLGGDIIVVFDGHTISSIEELRDAVAEHKPGDKVKVVISAARTRRA
jgi:S1-C subfamily serine protease